MIPKIIHYVWVGDSPKPDSVLQCINSWKIYLPDYEIVEWNNHHYETLKNNYTFQAYQLKKWAFVSDFLRVYSLYHHGGIYLDTDVEITDSLDVFLQHDFFSGHENFNGHCLPILTALMGCKPHHPIMKDILEQYAEEDFVTPTGINAEPNTYRFTKYFEGKFDICGPYDGEHSRVLSSNNVIYPTNYFCTLRPGLPNFAIHHFKGSWEYGYYRRNKFTFFSKYRLVRFKKIKHTQSNELPLLINESVMFQMKFRKDMIHCLVKVTS